MEGPSLRASENQLLGRFEVSGLRDLQLGILVNFHVNASGIIEVCRACTCYVDMQHDVVGK
jgi:hypothetical protein